jgi:hypothetical protein
MLSCVVVKKGEKEIPGLTDEVSDQEDWVPREPLASENSSVSPRPEGDKSAVNATALIKKNVIRRTFKSQKNPDAPLRSKSTLKFKDSSLTSELEERESKETR